MVHCCEVNSSITSRSYSCQIKNVVSKIIKKRVAGFYKNRFVLVASGNSRGLVDKSVGLVTKFRVRISKRSVVVLGRASNLKMLLCCIGNPAVLTAL